MNNRPHLEEERRSFCHQLGSMILQNKSIVYVDQTSVSLWMNSQSASSPVWQPKTLRLKIAVADSQFTS